MFMKSLLAASLAAPLLLSTSLSAQTTSTADPACMIKNADGTQKVDTTKCPDGKTLGMAKQIPSDTTKNAADMTKTPDPAVKSSADATKAPADAASTVAAAGSTNADTTVAASNSSAPSDILVSPDKMKGAKILSADDFIGKTVYSPANVKVGKVEDIILSGSGVQAVVLGVGGFLGMGTKDVAVTLSSIKVSKDGDSTKLMVEATKDQLKNAPTYDPKNRTYMN